MVRLNDSGWASKKTIKRPHIADGPSDDTMVFYIRKPFEQDYLGGN